MTIAPSVKEAMLGAIPNLRAFAISLGGNVDRADDLVEETLLDALAKVESYDSGTGMPAWLFAIMHNLIRSRQHHRRRREAESLDAHQSDNRNPDSGQFGGMEFEDFRAALASLPQDQREALLLVGASGFSYEEAAAICECAVGTIKSRVNRARTRLIELLSLEDVKDFAPEPATRAAMSAGSRH